MKEQLNVDGNIISYFAFCGLTFFILYQTSTMKPESALFPRMLSYILLALSLSLILLKFFKNISLFNKDRKMISEEKIRIKKVTHKNRKIIHEIYPFFIILFCILFLWGYDRIGFDLSAFGITFATMILIDHKEAFRKFYFAIIIPLILILIFNIGLGLRMPLFIEKFL